MLVLRLAITKPDSRGNGRKPLPQKVASMAKTYSPGFVSILYRMQPGLEGGLNN